jgi:hypothetical protein
MTAVAEADRADVRLLRDSAMHQQAALAGSRLPDSVM